MPILFDVEDRPEWILIVAGDDARLRRRQLDELQNHMQELKKRAVLVVEVSSDRVVTFDRDCHLAAEPAEVAHAYRITFDRFTASIVDGCDCVKWTAPSPVSFADIASTIDDLPHHDAENATRGPALAP